MAPITINGNTWDPAAISSSLPSLLSSSSSSAVAAEPESRGVQIPKPTVAANAEGTNYILIQAKELLSDTRKGELEGLGVKFQAYVDKNTYLCGYEKADLGILRARSFLEHVDVYHHFFKVDSGLYSAGLGAARAVPTVAGATGDAAGRAVPTVAGPPGDEDGVDVIIQLHEDAPLTTNELVDELDKLKMLHRDETDASANMIFTTIPRNRLAELAAIGSVRTVSENYDEDEDSNIALTVLNAPVYIPNPADVLGLIKCGGAHQVVHIADGGFDKGDKADPHPAFAGRVRALYSLSKKNPVYSDEKGHGTHVAGCAVGNGTTNTMGGIATTSPGWIRGTAPAATLVCTRRKDAGGKAVKGSFEDMMDRPYANDGARISNHSYSKAPDKTTPAKQVAYGLKNVNIDQYVLEKQDLLLCWSAGNSGQVGIPHQVGSSSACKNVLTVGNSFNARQMNVEDRTFNSKATSEADTYQMASTSSRGPTVEGRIKPDVCAPGATILSALTRMSTKLPTRYGESKDPSYFFDTGTSMSAPLVAGCAAVLREALGHQGVTKPSAALLKALLINGAVDILNKANPPVVNPQELQGFGRVNMGGTMHSVLFDKVVDAQTKAGGFVDAPDPTKQMVGLGSGEIASFTLRVPEPKEVFPNGDKYESTLKVTLTWMDAPGSLLVNMLGLSVTADSNVRRHGNKGSKDMSASMKDYDNVNNVQQVLWERVPVGKMHVAVECNHTLHPTDKIPYALAWSLE